MKNNFNIENNVIILTGGSGNLGSIYAEYLISNGAKVCNFDLTSPKDINRFDEKHENLQHRLDIIMDELGKLKKWNAEINVEGYLHVYG